MNAPEHARIAEDVPAWVLGALEPEEAERVERHLEGCPVCRADAERLRRSVDLLPRALEPVSPRPEVRAELMRLVRESAPPRPAGRPAAAPRRRLPRLLRPPALAAASAVLAVGVAAGFLAGRLAAPDPPRVVAAQVDASRLPGASASLVVPGETGSVPVLRLQGLELPGADRVYQVWLQRGGELVPSSVFTPRTDGTGAAAIPESLAGVDAVLVTRERPGGARTPSEEPLLRVPV